METHKLGEHGPLTMVVLEQHLIESAKFKGTFQYDVQGVVGNRPVRTYVSQKAFEGQLSRLGLTPASAIGVCLRFEQVSKDGTRYTNIYRADPSDVPEVTPKSGAVATTKMNPAEAAVVYAECVDAAIATLAAKLLEADIPVTAEAIQAAAATIFIKVTR